VIAIRLAARADVPALAELRRVSTSELHPGHDDEDFGGRFAAWYEREWPRRLTWLAEDEGAAVGMMNVMVTGIRGGAPKLRGLERTEAGG
jgi:hypothetical protein